MSVANTKLRSPARWVISGHVARGALRWAVVWGAVFGIFVFSTIKAFVISYPTAVERLKAVASLRSFAILLGVPHHAETVAGFTSWRVLTAIAVIGAIWGLLTSTRFLRGEEDAGRWELLLAGPTTRRRATAQALLGLGVALSAMLVITAALTFLSGRIPVPYFTVTGSLLFAVALVSGAAMFLGIGALASQLSATRGQAMMIGAGVLGASYVVRMVADSQNSLGWLRWLSPIGWLEELRPLRDPQPLALVPVVTLIAVCAGASVLLAGRRDLNASVLRERQGSLRSKRWLIGPASLALYLARPVALGWLAGVGGFAFMLGYMARSAATLLSSSPALSAALGRLGVRRGAEGYLGFAFFIAAAVIAVIAAGQIAAMRDEEASGRLDNLLTQPVTRFKWLAARLCISLSIVLSAGVVAGFLAWMGASSQHTGVTLPKLLEAGVNATVPAIVVLGLGGLAFGVRPRLSAVVAYGVVAWSFLANLLGSLVKGSDWLRDSSLFSHIALAPAVRPDWETAGVMVLFGIGAGAIGLLAFRRRDVEYG